ncbi:MAG: DMT family transporter [Bacteroidales bacterium]|nr:DMT family transporter [Bacteroidales bacterium]
MKKDSPLIIYPLLVIAMLCWSFSFIWAKQALANYNPITIIYLRTIVASVILFLILLVTKKGIKIRLKHLPIFIILALFEPFLYFLGETNGLTKVDASTAGIIIGTIPLFTPIVAYFFLKEKISLLNIIGIFLSVVGVAIMTFDINLNMQVSPEGLMLLGVAILATLGYTVAVKKIPEEYSVFTITFYQNLIGSFMFLPLVIIFEKDNIMQAGFVWESIFPIIELGIFASAAAFVCYTYTLRYIPIARANIFTNLIPVFTLFLSALLLGEEITIQKIIGITVVLTGVFVAQAKKKQTKLQG